MKKTRVLIVGGGFGGLYAALEFEKRRFTDIDVTLISEENFFLTPYQYLEKLVGGTPHKLAQL